MNNTLQTIIDNMPPQWRLDIRLRCHGYEIFIVYNDGTEQELKPTDKLFERVQDALT